MAHFGKFITPAEAQARADEAGRKAEQEQARDKHKVPYTENQILSRKAGNTSGNFLAIHCPHEAGHKHGDKNPSGTYNRSTGFYECRAAQCGIKGFASDRNRGDWRATYRKQTYWYGQNRQGKPLQIIRTPDKQFRAVGKVRQGELWPMYNAGGLDSETLVVYVVEGEQQADAVADHHALLTCTGAVVAGTSVVCITSKGGSNAADKTDWEPLKRHLTEHPHCQLCLIPDCDAAGRAYMASVHRLLEHPDAQVIDLSPFDDGSTKGFDITDFLAAGHRFADLVDHTSKYVHSTATEPQERPKASSVLVSMAGWEPQEWEFLMNGWLPLYELTIIAGEPGSGKGTTLCAIAAATTGGRHWPDGTKTKPRRILWVGTEDHPTKTLLPRLLAAGARQDMCMFYNEPMPADLQTALNPAEVLAGLEAPPEDPPALIIVDPLIQSMSGGTNDAATVRQHCEAWVRVAREWGAAVLGVAHTPKYMKTKAIQGAMQDLIAGSSQWTAVARSGWILLRDQDDPTGPRLLARIKQNYDTVGVCPSYTVHASVTNNVAHVVRFEADQDGAMTARLMAEGKDDKRSDTAQAILDYLADAPDKQARSREVIAAVRESEKVSQQSVDRAGKKLAAQGKLSIAGDKMNQPIRWCLPEAWKA